MSHSVCLRLMWKEYRTLRGFWIALALVTVLGQLIVLLSAQLSGAVPSWLIFSFTLGLAAFYALGCGATMFAAEHEEATYEFLHSRPARALEVLSGKLVWALVSTMVFGVVLWTAAWVMSGAAVLPADMRFRLLKLWGVGALELLAWGMCFSLILRSPLQAATLGAAVALFVVQLVRLLYGLPAFALESYASIASVRLGLVVAVMLFNAGLALRWLRPMETTRAICGLGKESHSLPDRPVSSLALRGGQSQLLWQAWRELVPVHGVLALAAVPLAIGIVLTMAWVNAGGAGIEPDPVLILLVIAVALPTASSLIGSSVFLPDQQRGQYRFFADLGVGPRRVWFSRQAIGLASVAVLYGAVMAATGLCVLAAWGGYPLSDGGIPENWRYWGTSAAGWALAAALCFLAYACSQFCSILFRSSILAGLFGLAITVFTCAWALLMVYLRFNPLWSVVPIPLGLLLATWLRVSDWIHDRHTAAGWARVVSAAVLPVVGVASLVAVARVDEIPKLGPGFDVAEYTRPETAAERETADLYRKAYDLVTLMPTETRRRVRDARSYDISLPLTVSEINWVEQNQPSLDQIYEAASRPRCAFASPGDHPWHSSFAVHSRRIGLLLSVSARRHELQQSPELALNDYLAVLRLANHLRQRGNWSDFYDAQVLEVSAIQRLILWSAHEGISSELLKKAIGLLEAIDDAAVSPGNAQKWEYLWMRRVCRADEEAISILVNNPDVWRVAQVRSLLLLSWLAPWEKTRAVRLLNLLTHHRMQEWRELEQAVASPDPHGRRVRSRRPCNWTTWESTEPHFPSAKRWIETTPALKLIWARTRWGWGIDTFQTEVWRRGVRLVLALQAWRLDHGQLPATLSELTRETEEGSLTGSHQIRMLLDPFTGEPFRYFPDGAPSPVRWPIGGWERPEIPAGQPLIWSTGFGVDFRSEVTVANSEMVLREEDDEDMETSKTQWYVGGDHASGATVPVSEAEAIRQGWAFPIPQ